MNDPLVSVILRSYNEGWALRETLRALAAQEYKNWELIVIDSGSTDGSIDLIHKARPEYFVQIKHSDYNPSRVMNHGMQLARSEFGIFLNADATPQGSGWLQPLVAGLQDPKVAAVFGRQIPRLGCRAVYAHDYERCFGPKRESTQWEHFFSMVSSGLRKDIWSQRGFLEIMQYSEDDEYTRWCRAEGYRVVYVPESIVMHSHNYTAQQAYKRSFGEAKALAAVWNGAQNQINFSRTVLLGWTNDARRDLLFCSRQKCLREWPHAARIRWHQRRAKFAGFREGWKFYRNGNGDLYSEERGIHAASPAEMQHVPEISGAAVIHSLKRPEGRAPEQLLIGRRRFTIDGNLALENRLLQTCEKVLAAVGTIIPARRLQLLALGGGYGRGQGGVLKTNSGDAPYNDMEFYVFLSGNRVLNERKYGKLLRHLGEELAPEAGLHVEFKIDSLARLRRGPVTMFSYDLLSGHRILFGSENAFDGCEHHLNNRRIPLFEATRLLFNRCTGLLLAKELLRKSSLSAEDEDFIGRNLAKAQLALGDAFLAAFGRYQWNCLERSKALGKFDVTGDTTWLTQVIHHHAAGVQFKLHPERSSQPPAALQAEHEAVSNLAREAWLWLENRRLNHQFSSIHDYAFSREMKNAESAMWRNVLLNAKTFGLKSIFGVAGLRYPRERLLISLPLLLWDEPLNDLRVKRHLQKQLRTRASDWQGFVAAYKAVWPKFS